MSDQLKSLAERIERLMDERDGLGADIRDIFMEAKSAGYVPKVLRKAITRKRMDPSKRDEEDAILELYEGALGAVGKALAAVRAGSTWKEAAADHSVPRATLARAVKSQKLQTDTKEYTAGPEQGAVSSSLPPDDASHADRTDEPPATPILATGASAGTTFTCRITGSPEPCPTCVKSGMCAWDNCAASRVTTPDVSGSDPAVRGSGLSQPDACSTEEETTKSCGLCPVPPGSVAPDHDGNGFRMKGEAEPLAATSRGHSLASCDGVLANDWPASQCEDSASPGPQEPIDDGLEIPAFLRRARA